MTQTLRPKFQYLFAGLLLSSLTACALSGVTVTRVDYAQQYSPQEVGAASVIPVAVHGNPFGGSDAEFRKYVIKSMQGQTFGVPVRFTQAPEQADPNQRFHVVLVFASTGSASPNTLCGAKGDRIPATTRTSGSVNLLGAFCSKDRYLSHAIARANEVPGPGSEKLDAVISQLTLNLFPDENPNNQVEVSTDGVFVD